MYVQVQRHDRILTVERCQRTIDFKPVIICEVVYVRQPLCQFCAIPGLLRGELPWEAIWESTFIAGIILMFL